MNIQLNEKLPSIISDPFKKISVTRIYVAFNRSLFNDKKWKANGTVEFKNGNTSGSQDFEGETFDEVVVKIKAMIDNLE